MSNFKIMVERDRDSVFLNPKEFGEMHEIEGRDIMAVIDTPSFEESAMAAVGLADCDILVFAKVEDLPRIRPAGESLNVDGREYSITSWGEDCGIAVIQLAQKIAG